MQNQKAKKIRYYLDGRARINGIEIGVPFTDWSTIGWTDDRSLVIFRTLMYTCHQLRIDEKLNT